MRLHVLSDLHLERGIDHVPVADADAVILAGDIATGTRGVEWARGWAGGRPVIYVAGNHEFYGHSMPELVDDLRRVADRSSVHVLQDDEVVLDGVRFLGCTLWSDFDFDGPKRRELAMRLCERAVTDYQVIRFGPEDRMLAADDTRRLHLASRQWLNERLAERHDGPTVVVTHHAPFVPLRPPAAVMRLIAGAFASDVTDLMGRERVDLWVFGHTHRVADADVDGTRILSNPRGYPNEPVAGFDPSCVVEARAPA